MTHNPGEQLRQIERKAAINAAKRRYYSTQRRSPLGAPPGTLIADSLAPKPVLTAYAYGQDGMEEQKVTTAEEITSLRNQYPVLWIDVAGLGDADVIRQLGKLFSLHELALEDVLNVHQRPKVEDYGAYIFMATRIPISHSETETEQIALFLGKNFVLTFQEQLSDSLDPVRDRIRKNSKGKIHHYGADYLAYTILDAAIDSYFPILEAMDERIHRLEDEVITTPRREIMQNIHSAKRDLRTLRRAIWPQREMINALIREETPLITRDTQIFLRDCYDHVVQLIDILEVYREVTSDLVDVYLSNLNARMNEIMKVLTIIATIFIPLSFIASLYGMNFNPETSPYNMPELGWYFGYPLVLTIMLAVAAGFLWYFYRKGWLGRIEEVIDKSEGHST